MRLIEDSNYKVIIELSESNLRAMLADFESSGSTSLTKASQGVLVQVLVARDDAHYTRSELAERGPNWKGAVNA